MASFFCCQDGRWSGPGRRQHRPDQAGGDWQCRGWKRIRCAMIGTVERERRGLAGRLPEDGGRVSGERRQRPGFPRGVLLGGVLRGLVMDVDGGGGLTGAVEVWQDAGPRGSKGAWALRSWQGRSLTSAWRSNARASISPYHMNRQSKGIRWMPWRQVPTKDVVHCEKLRRGVCSRKSRGYPNGETRHP